MATKPPRSAGKQLPEGKSAILKAARSLLGERGGSQFTLTEVAKRSGKNIALISYYFGGREEMLLAILDEDQALITKPLEQQREWNDPAEVRLERHLSGMVKMWAKRPYLTPLTAELLRRSGPKSRDEIVDRLLRPVVDIQREILEQGRAEGVFRDIDPMVFYLYVMGAVDMLFNARNTIENVFGRHGDDASLQEHFVQQTMSLVMDGIRLPASTGK
ncbi:transcriptional regulator, TetR family [Sphingobium sp. AP50]|uniref:TetR family transcriptional regulator n=1 Tax=Sphingobium sp. AP50 TaxID=1884369 RepID=UPI0008AE52DC|nr:TetR family transcriptional regulator [Sphingobium sp. AP50]SEK05655.1 transcriptional regulator, TetR family [Sphingobium sp. AP50]